MGNSENSSEFHFLGNSENSSEFYLLGNSENCLEFHLLGKTQALNSKNAICVPVFRKKSLIILCVFIFLTVKVIGKMVAFSGKDASNINCTVY